MRCCWFVTFILYSGLFSPNYTQRFGVLRSGGLEARTINLLLMFIRRTSVCLTTSPAISFKALICEWYHWSLEARCRVCDTTLMFVISHCLNADIVQVVQTMCARCCWRGFPVSGNKRSLSYLKSVTG